MVTVMLSIIPPYGDIVNVVVSRPGLPPSDFPGHGGVDGGSVGDVCVGVGVVGGVLVV